MLVTNFSLYFTNLLLLFNTGIFQFVPNSSMRRSLRKVLKVPNFLSGVTWVIQFGYLCFQQFWLWQNRPFVWPLLYVSWRKISHQLWSSCTRSPQWLWGPGEKSPGRSPMHYFCWYWTSMSWSIDSCQNRVWLYRGRRCTTHWEKKEIKRKNKTNTL